MVKAIILVEQDDNGSVLVTFHDKRRTSYSFADRNFNGLTGRALVEHVTGIATGHWVEDAQRQDEIELDERRRLEVPLIPF